MADRDSKGRFVVGGEPGNPRGRPKQFEKIRRLAQEHSEEAFLQIVEIVRDEMTPSRDRHEAAKTILVYPLPIFPSWQ